MILSVETNFKNSMTFALQAQFKDFENGLQSVNSFNVGVIFEIFERTLWETCQLKC